MVAQKSKFLQPISKIRNLLYILVFFTEYLSWKAHFFARQIPIHQFVGLIEPVQTCVPSPPDLSNARNIPFDQLIYAYKSCKKNFIALLW